MAQNSKASKSTRTLSLAKTKVLQNTLSKILSDPKVGREIASRTEGLEDVVPTLLDARRPIVVSDEDGIYRLLLVDVDQFGWAIITSPDCKVIRAIEPMWVSFNDDASTER